jgi:short subunit dehydrogenase-like uncharacterized protein
MKDRLLLYGANGYTGQLIIEQCLAKNISPVLSGRNEEKLKPLSEKYNLEYRVVALDNNSCSRSVYLHRKTHA